MSNLKVDNTEKTKASIEVTDHLEFKGDMKTDIISSIDMADVVSSLFAPAFADYYGCKICINNGRNPTMAAKLPYGMLYVDLFFKDQGMATGKGWKNIQARNSSNNENLSMGDRFQMVNGTGNARAYNVTPQTYEALEEFMLSGSHTRWAEHTTETPISMSVYGKNEIVVCISGLVLNKVITKIYGDKTADDRYEYDVTLSNLIPHKNDEFLIQVCQLSVSAVRNMERVMGIYSANSPQFHRYQR